ncbi:hypothetical protein FQZ97_926910 [compost metagenome]
MLVQQPVLAVAGERVERHVGHHAQLRELLLQLAHHPRHQAVRVHGFFAIGRLERLVDHREQRHHRNAQFHAVFGHGQQQVQAQALHAGHGTHGLAPMGPIQHKHRVDQVGRAEPVLAHQVTGERIAPQTAGAGQGVGGWSVHLRIVAKPQRVDDPVRLNPVLKVSETTGFQFVKKWW